LDRRQVCSRKTLGFTSSEAYGSGVVPPEAHPESNAAEAAHDMGEAGDIVPDKNPEIELPPQVEDGHQQERQRHLAPGAAGGSGEDDEHEDHAAGAHQGRAPGQKDMEDAAHQRGNGNHQQESPLAVVLFNQGAQHQQQAHVGEIVAEIRMPQHVQEEPGIEKNLAHRRAVDGKEGAGAAPAGQKGQDQDQEGDEGIAQGDGGGKLYPAARVKPPEERFSLCHKASFGAEHAAACGGCRRVSAQ
jgi:hypothetical protein